MGPVPVDFMLFCRSDHPVAMVISFSAITLPLSSLTMRWALHAIQQS